MLLFNVKQRNVFEACTPYWNNHNSFLSLQLQHIDDILDKTCAVSQYQYLPYPRARIEGIRGYTKYTLLRFFKK